MISLSAENRAKAAVAGGDEVDVDLVLDDAPREVERPSDLVQALDAHPSAKRAFDALSYSGQCRYVASIEGAKTAETRERRIGRAISDLTDG